MVIVFVAAIAAIAASGGDDSSPGAVASSPSATVALEPNAPAQLKASVGAFEVRLSWEAGSGDGSETDVYDIVRDGRVVGHAKPAGTSWTDDDVLPTSIYDYQVIAVSADGARRGSSVRAKTKAAPPGTAALTGVFNVKVHPTSHTGFSSFSDKDFTAGWRFVPQCKQPPCDTQVRNFNVKDFTTTLRLAEGTYTGPVTVSGYIHCGSASLISTFTITVHATGSDVVNNAWKVTRFSGELTMYSSAQFGCVSSSARYDVTGALQNT